mgnify:CR=1 FL=1
MEISEVRVKLVDNPRERLQAFCSITLDGDFVVRDLKVIEGTSGPFVAMPSRKLADRCDACGAKNPLRAKFCNECGVKLNENRAPKDPQGRAKLHADIAHPINAECRERIQQAVIEAYEAEREAAKLPGYQPKSIDDYNDDFEEDEPSPPKPQLNESRDNNREKRPAAAAPARNDRSNRRAERDAEPVDGKEIASDYNSLIADLKKEATDRDHQRGGYRPDNRRREEPPRRERFEPEPAAKQQPEPRKKQEEPKQQVSKPATPPPAPKPTQAPAPKPAPAPPVQEEDDFGAGLL